MATKRRRRRSYRWGPSGQSYLAMAESNPLSCRMHHNGQKFYPLPSPALSSNRTCSPNPRLACLHTGQNLDPFSWFCTSYSRDTHKQTDRQTDGRTDGLIDTGIVDRNIHISCRVYSMQPKYSECLDRSIAPRRVSDRWTIDYDTVFVIYVTVNLWNQSFHVMPKRFRHFA